MQPKTAYTFKVILDSDDKPYREIAIKPSQSLSTLAVAIVESFGFDFDHCYGFYNNFNNPNKSTEIYELFTDIGEEPTEGARGVEHTAIRSAFPQIGKTMRFLFDYGDGWKFHVELLREESIIEKTKYPKLIGIVGKAPQQYPPLDEDIEAKPGEDDWFDDYCPLCRQLKESGTTMQWFSGDPRKSKRIKN